MENKNTNPLGTEKIGSLLMKFAIPSIIAMLVSSLYNIVDQFFIGRSVGMLGNAATNVALPVLHWRFCAELEAQLILTLQWEGRRRKKRFLLQEEPLA